jgi:hypothetical protein
MSEILPVTNNSIVWNENAILEQGKSFINQKNNELKIFQSFWNASLGNDFFNPSAKTTSRLFKAVAEASREEIKNLNDSVVTLLNHEIANNPESEKMQQLLKIYSVSDAAFNYFTSVVNDSYYPTYFNQSIRDGFSLSGQAALTAGVATGAAYLIQQLKLFTLSDTAYLPAQLTTAAFISSFAIWIINQALRVEKNNYKINELKTIFEKALNPEQPEPAQT